MGNSEVLILERKEVQIMPFPNLRMTQIHIAYKAPDLPAAIVHIDKRKWSPEVEALAIQADIQIRKNQLTGG